MRQWYIDAQKSDSGTACGPSYWNNVKGKSVKMALQTNVVDSQKENRIAPNEVHYLLDGKTKIGVGRASDPDVGSGIINVAPGAKVQACVTPEAGQNLWAFVALTALSIV